MSGLDALHANWERGVALHERRDVATGFTYHFDIAEACLQFLPEDTQLHFRQPVTHAAMDAVAKRDVLTRVRSIETN